MTNYILVYKSPKDFDMSQLPKEQVSKIMEAWGEWLGNMGAAVVDKGDAFKKGGVSVGSDGAANIENPSSGYTIIQADNFDEALAHAESNPTLKNGGRVEVYEAFGLTASK